MRLGPPGPSASVLRRSHAARARDVFEWAQLAETALDVNAICQAAKHARVALRVPKVGSRGLVCEGARLRAFTRGAWNVLVALPAAESATNVNAIGKATVHVLCALRVPKIIGFWLAFEGASSARWCCYRFWARYACERMLPTKAALRVDAVCPAALFPHLALFVPIIRNRWLIREVAT